MHRLTDRVLSYVIVLAIKVRKKILGKLCQLRDRGLQTLKIRQ